MEIDVKQLISIARRRWWIVFVITLLSAMVAYGVSSRQTPIYSASTTLLVNPGIPVSASEADYQSLLASQRLADTYKELVTTSPMKDRVATVLGQDTLDSEITTSVVTSSQLIEITVTDPSAEQAALVANTMASELQGYISEQAAKRSETTRSNIDNQTTVLENRLEDIDQAIAELDGEEGSTAERQVTDLLNERSHVNESLLQLQSDTLNIDTQLMAASATIEIVEPAAEPESPISPQPMRSMLLGAFVGALLGAGVVALLEFLDNTVKPEVNVQGLADAPVLATISQLPKINPGGQQVYSITQPQSGAAEAMRLLRTNLEFAAASEPVEALTITSAGPGEGKSTTVANLGVVMAQAGMNVAILDADLRKPTQHRVFGVENTRGLTTLLTHPDETWQTVSRKVALKGLYLIPSGPIPPNPSDLLSSQRFVELVAQIREEVDIVIVDSPPLLSASDALITSRQTDGVMIVAHSGKTRIDALRHAAHSVHQGGMRLVGVVLNRQKGQRGASYYGEYYGAAQTPTPSPSPPQGD